LTSQIVEKEQVPFYTGRAADVLFHKARAISASTHAGTSRV
jgi:hypothetical protein